MVIEWKRKIIYVIHDYMIYDNYVTRMRICCTVLEKWHEGGEYEAWILKWQLRMNSRMAHGRFKELKMK